MKREMACNLNNIACSGKYSDYTAKKTHQINRERLTTKSFTSIKTVTRITVAVRRYYMSGTRLYDRDHVQASSVTASQKLVHAHSDIF